MIADKMKIWWPTVRLSVQCLRKVTVWQEFMELRMCLISVLVIRMCGTGGCKECDYRDCK